MSYDLRVWCVNAPECPVNEIVAEGRGWAVIVATCTCLAEDVPDEVSDKLPGIQYIVELTLEPIHAPNVGRTALWKAARKFARSAHGVIEDRQEGTVELPSGVKRYTPIKRDSHTHFAVLAMSWWFDHSRLFEPGAIERLLTVIQRSLPEAMPRRYGLYEPAQHEFATTGRDHFVSFFLKHIADHVVWSPHRPVLHVFTSLAQDPGWISFGRKTVFRCNRITIEIDSAALDQPGWEENLRRAWRAISAELHPFFGDVRTLHGRVAYGRSLGSDAETEPDPVLSWWWHGIPSRLGHAIVVGEPYLSVWPELAGQAQFDGGLAYVSTADWRVRSDAVDLVGGVPSRLAIGFMPRKKIGEGRGVMDEHYEEYPDEFPFARPAE